MKALVPFLLFIFLDSIEATNTIDCQNGGFFNGSACNCLPNWGGEDCSSIQCINGGYTNDNTYCICPTGYMGIHCDAVSKFKTPSGMFPELQTFTLVYINLFSHYWGGLVYSQFNSALKSHLNSSNYTEAYLITNEAQMTTVTNTNVSSSYDFHTTSLLSDADPLLPPPQNPGKYNCYYVPFYDQIVKHIKDNNLRETAITIFTQHPALLNSDSYQNLLNIANAFDIRINVVFSDDSTFVRCDSNDTQLQELRDLAANTGGLFVTAQQIPDYGATGTIIDAVLATHYRYEPVAMAVSGETTSLQMYTNLPPKAYYFVAYGSKDQTVPDPNTSNCSFASLQRLGSSSDSVFAWFSTSSYFLRPCTISFNATKAQVFGVDFRLGPVGVRLYKSYVEAAYLDTSKTQPNQGNPLLLSLHVEPYPNMSVSVLEGSYNEDNNTPIPLTFTNRNNEATFDWISSPFNCSGKAKNAWISIWVKGMSNLNETRYIPVFCQSASSSTSNPQASSTTNPQASSTTNPQASSTTNPQASSISNPQASSTSNPQTGSTPNPQATQTKTFVMAYSTLATKNAHNNYVLGSIRPAQDAYQPFNSFGEIRFDTTLTTDVYHSQGSDYPAFQSAVQNQYGLNYNDTIGPTAPSNVLDALENIKAADSVTQNSLISINLARLLLTDTGDLEHYYYFVNKNIKLVFFINTADMNTSIVTLKQKFGILPQLAAITSGHFIICDEEDSSFKTTILPAIYSQGPGQNLLLSKNLQGVGQPSLVLGTIDLTSFSSANPMPYPITVTATTDVIDSDTTIPFIPICIGFYYENSTQVVKVNVTQHAGSNFYTGNANISTGFKYVVRPITSILPNRNTLIRVWTQIDDKTPDLQVNYYDLNNIILENKGPNDYDGAALGVHAPFDDGSKISMYIIDCTGNDLTLYDTNQKDLNLSRDNEARFVPFFCTNSSDSSKVNCFPGTQNLYFARFVANDLSNSYTYTKSFICQQDTRLSDTSCIYKDKEGNVLCSSNSAPYTRGRAGQLIDCSSSNPLESYLQYDPNIAAKINETTGNTNPFAPYRCNCNQGDKGFSCEQTLCKPKNEEGGAVDAQYRTFTFVMGVDGNDMGSLLDDASLLFGDLKEENITVIWQYQFLLACPEKDVVPIYIGRDQNAFMTGFNKLIRRKQYESLCSSPIGQFSLNNILKTAVSSIGRQQRGLIVFYHELRDISCVTVNVSLTEFIQTAQKYRQEFYIYNNYEDTPPILSADVLTAIMTTSGSILQFSLDYEKPILPSIFVDMLKGITAINAHQVPSNVTHSYAVPLEAGKNYLVISANSSSSIDLLTNKDFDYISNCQSANSFISQFGLTCILDSTKTLTITQNPDLWFSVISTENKATPLGILISERFYDQTSAYAVDYTGGGPTLAIYPSDYYNVTGDVSNNARVALRNNCTYVSTADQIFTPLPAGYSKIVMSFALKDPSTSVNKVFPFGVSSKIACMDGNTKEENALFGKCDCMENWEGPDCSRPKCINGKLNTWQDACNCSPDSTGQFCTASTGGSGNDE